MKLLAQPIIQNSSLICRRPVLSKLQRRQYQYRHQRSCTCLLSTKAASGENLADEFQFHHQNEQLDIEGLRTTQHQHITEQRKQLIACKIYMNVGGDSSHVPVLHDLMVHAQDKFAALAVSTNTTNTNTTTSNTIDDNNNNTTTTSSNKTALQNEGENEITTMADRSCDKPDDDSEPNKAQLDYTRVGALVRVDMDPLSNRSSFHLAGPVWDMISVTNELIEMALPTFANMKRGVKLPPEVKKIKATHKVVDIIEHVSFLPLLPEPQSKITDNKKLYPPLWVPTYPSFAARKVGTMLREQMKLQVFFYAYAQRNNLSYEDIVHRRMKQYSLLNNLPASTLVGAFPDYVEDVHVLLAAQCGKQRIRDLVPLLNSTDTGLSDVVATAQLYDLYQWDIHCRLLRPHLSGSNMAAIEHVMKQWNQLQKGPSDQIPMEYVVKCFRVGPTYDECINALQKVCKSEQDRYEFDQDVRAIFQSHANYYTKSS